MSSYTTLDVNVAPAVELLSAQTRREIGEGLSMAGTAAAVVLGTGWILYTGVFDIAGLYAGSRNMRPLEFFLVCFLGKVLKMFFVPRRRFRYCSGYCKVSLNKKICK